MRKFFQDLHIESQYDPAIPFLDRFSKGSISYYKIMSLSTFAVQYTIVRKWK